MCLFWTQRKIFWMKFVIRLFWGTIDFHSRRKILLCFPHSSEYRPEQTHSYRFGSTWGWGNDDRSFIFGWTVPLRHDRLCLCEYSPRQISWNTVILCIVWRLRDVSCVEEKQQTSRSDLRKRYSSQKHTNKDYFRCLSSIWSIGITTRGVNELVFVKTSKSTKLHKKRKPKMPSSTHITLAAVCNCSI